MHESWHKYVPNIPNGFFYNAFALMLLSDPQLYQMTHGFHHSKVHTYEDAEFHPVGDVRNRAVRIIYNWLEVVIGVAWLVLMASLAVPFDPRFSKRYRLWKLPLSAAAWVILMGGIGFLSHAAFGVSLLQIVIPFVASVWLHSFALHQSQLIEHGNLYVDGTFDERNIWTRNLKKAGVIESHHPVLHSWRCGRACAASHPDQTVPASLPRRGASAGEGGFDHTSGITWGSCGGC